MCWTTAREVPKLARIISPKAIERQALQSDSRLSPRLIRLWRKQACGLERPVS